MANARPNISAQSATIKHVAATVGTNSPDLAGGSGRGLIVFADVSAITGTAPTLIVTIQGKDPVSGNYYTILASAALTATGTTVLRVFPGLTAVANATVNDILPPDFRIITAIGGATPAVSATVSFSVVE